MAQPMLQALHLSKVFRVGEEEMRVLKDITLTIEEGQFVAIMGPSGSGKSTLMYLLGGLDRPTSGQIIVNHQRIDTMTGDDLARFRREMNGFVFQSFYLVPTLTAIENVALPGIFNGQPAPERMARAARLLRFLKMEERLHHRPSQLSGGQQQRVAIARALFNDPPILMADEPTGALDSATGTIVMRMLRHLSTAQNKTVVVVTHDEQVARFADRLVRLKDGAIVDDQLIQHEDDPNAA
ncbi:ABC transporter ATP-binding protein (plasmid) [Aggregatilineales bacterium SYSU G02658]